MKKLQDYVRCYVDHYQMKITAEYINRIIHQLLPKQNIDLPRFIGAGL